jgi:hypothetical protein
MLYFLYFISNPMSAPANVGYRRDRDVRLNVESCHFRAPFGGGRNLPN